MNLAKAIMTTCRDEKNEYIPNFGLPYAGGYYGGYIKVNGLLYAIVVAPKVGGESSAAMLYRSSVTAFPTGNESTNDGILIRDNMIAAGISTFPAQQFCVNLSIGGYTDWYLPTQDEFEIVYRNLKPTVALNVTTDGINPSAVPPTVVNYTTGNPVQTQSGYFKTGQAQSFVSDYYSCATKGTSTTTYMLKRVTTGATYSEGYGFTHWVRAFRRVLIVQ